MRTSINIRCDLVSSIAAAALKSGITASELINLCLRSYYSSFPRRLIISKIKDIVEYQDRGAGYVIFNVSFDVDVYNLNVDFRSFCRLSVSKIVDMAVLKFLDNVVKEHFKKNQKRDLHNYVELIHLMRHNDDPSRRNWKIDWKITSREAP